LAPLALVSGRAIPLFIGRVETAATRVEDARERA
jgi:hypothetical protein